MKLFDRIDKTEGVLAFGERALRWGPLLLGTTVSSAIAGWAAAVTKVLEQYAPASWVGAGLAGGLLFTLAAAAWSYVRVNVARLEFVAEQRRHPDQFNPLDDTFTKQRIHVQALRSEFNEPVVGKTFVDCELHGPAVILLHGQISMAQVAIGNCEFVRVRNGAGVFNAIPFQNLTVTRGKMKGLTILVPEGAVDQVNAGVQGIQWITH